MWSRWHRLNMNQEEVIRNKMDMVFFPWWWMHVSVHTSGTHEKSRCLNKRWITVFSYALYRKQIPCIYSLHQREETFCCYYEVPLFSNHSTSHCSVRCSRHSLVVLNKAKFVFTLLISPGRILIISEKVWQRCDLKKRLIFAINFIKDNEVIL